MQEAICTDGPSEACDSATLGSMSPNGWLKGHKESGTPRAANLSELPPHVKRKKSIEACGSQAQSGAERCDHVVGNTDKSGEVSPARTELGERVYTFQTFRDCWNRW